MTEFIVTVRGQPEAPGVMRTILCKLCQSVPRPKLGPTTIRVEGCTIGICGCQNMTRIK